MHKPKFVFENERHKILWDFEMQMDHPIQVRRPDLVFKRKKRTSYLVDFAGHRVKVKRRQKLVKYLDIARELKNIVAYIDIDIS